MKITHTLLFLSGLLFLNSCQYPLQQQNAADGTAHEQQAANPYGVPGQGSTIPDTSSYQEVNPPYQASTPTAPAPIETAPAHHAPSAAGASTHLIKKGDTLWGLSRQYGTSVDAIRQANGLTGNIIQVGQQLQIPSQ